jgi:hypothetical protein
MNEAYNRTLFALRTDYWWAEMEAMEIGFLSIGAEDNPFEVTNLHSWRMTAFYSESEYDNEATAGRLRYGLFELAEKRFKRWLYDDLRNGFDHQLFEPYELYRWISDSGLRTSYQFMSEEVSPQSSSQPLTGTINSTAERRDLLKPVIEHAQSQCINRWDVAEVWGKLRALAHSKYSPLIGTDEQGIQYLDVSEQLKSLNFRALSMRLTRARKGTIEKVRSR